MNTICTRTICTASVGNECLCTAEKYQRIIDVLRNSNLNLVQRNAMLRQRPDLPVDRIPVYDELMKQINALEQANSELSKLVALYRKRAKKGAI